MQLTEHFSLAELTRSDIALRRGINNALPHELLDNATYLARGLEQVRALLAVPIYISSGYRCPALNSAVGGSSKSHHLEARAADFTAPAFGSPLMICRVIERSQIQFDQLIQEGNWVHISFPADLVEGARVVMTAHFENGKATYTQGLA